MCYGMNIEEGMELTLLVRILSVNNVPTAPVLSMDVVNSDTQGNNTILTWTQSTTPTTNQVWASDNGGGYYILASLPGATTTYADTSKFVPAGNSRYYKVIAVNSAGSSPDSNIVGTALNISLTGAATFPNLWATFGTISNSGAGLTAVSFPDLRRIYSLELVLDNCANLTSISAPNLQYTDAGISVQNCASLAGVLSLPSLINGGFPGSVQLQFNGCPNITALNFPSLNNELDAFWFNNCTKLNSVIIGSGCVMMGGNEIHGQNCALNASTVNNILHIGATSPDLAGGLLQINLDGGTNAAPTGQGIADKGALIANGNICTTN